jgi:type IV fimbrial biogenesis protein FimT
MKNFTTKQTGYTLGELLLTVAIGGILTGLAATAFPDLLKNNQMVGDVNSLVGHINLARSEAIKRNLPAALCQTNDSQAATPICNSVDANWDTGWLIFVDDDGDQTFDVGEFLISRGDPSGAVEMVAGMGELGFAADGFLSTGQVLFSLCDARGIDHGRQLSVSVTGRPEVSKTFVANTDCTDATP